MLSSSSDSPDTGSTSVQAVFFPKQELVRFNTSVLQKRLKYCLLAVNITVNQGTAANLVMDTFAVSKHLGEEERLARIGQIR